MGSWGTAGESARDGYRSAVRRRRGLGALRLAVGCAAPLAAWLAYGAFHGRGRLIVEGLLVVAFSGAVLWPSDRDTRRWLRGAGGETATASLLEGLPAKRWEVFHDLAVPGSRSNIDHLAVGPTGVWVIDSKTTRAPVRVGMLSVRIGERRLDTEPVRWQAGIVSERLGVTVRPVIALHCAVDAGTPRLPRRGVRRGGVRVLLADDLVRRLRRARRRFRRGDVEAIADEVEARFRPAALLPRPTALRGQNWARD